MSENEQKAGCVDDAAIERAMDAMFGSVEYQPGYGGYCGREAMRAALEAAALSPARSGEAVDKGPWHIGKDGDIFSDDFTVDAAIRVSGDFEDNEQRRRYAEWLCAALNNASLGVIAPRTESSGVSPGGGDGLLCSVCDRFDCCPELHYATPAPQDSVRVGDAVAELRFLYRAYVNLLEAGADRIASLGGTCDSVPAMERADPALIQVRRFLESATTPAPAAGADGELVLRTAIHMEDAVRFIEHHYPDAPQLDRGPILRNMKRWAAKLRTALSDGAGQSAGGG